jgi:ABC-type branched-subunit amino acid transport system substrate-binding protein
MHPLRLFLQCHVRAKNVSTGLHLAGFSSSPIRQKETHAMTRFTRIRVLLLVLLSGLLIADAVQAEPVKLTVLLAFSNIYKNYGPNTKKGFLLGVPTEAAEQNVDWQSWVTFEFLDTRVDKAHTLQLAKNAIANGSKGILGMTSSGPALYIRDYVLDEAGDKPRWACIHADYTWGIAVCDAFLKGYGQVGEEIGRIPVPLKTVNKKQYLVQLAKLKPDFALAAFVGGEAVIFLRDYYRFKVHETIPLVVPGNVVSSDMLLKHAETLEQYGTGIGVISAHVYTPTLENEANKRFIAECQQAYQEMPNIIILRGYDAGRLLIKALAKLQGQWDGQQVIQLMKTLPYISPRHGQQLRFDSHGDAINPGYIFKTKRDGNRLVNEMIGQVAPINMDDYQ